MSNFRGTNQTIRGTNLTSSVVGTSGLTEMVPWGLQNMHAYKRCEIYCLIICSDMQIIGCCVSILVLSSALPVMSRTLGEYKSRCAIASQSSGVFVSLSGSMSSVRYQKESQKANAGYQANTQK